MGPVILTVSCSWQDGRLLAGAGAVELELARKITHFGETLPGLEQYAVKKFATALESFISIFADNSGQRSSEVLAKLYAAHHEGKVNTGFNIQVRSILILRSNERDSHRILIFCLHVTGGERRSL